MKIDKTKYKILLAKLNMVAPELVKQFEEIAKNRLKSFDYNDCKKLSCAFIWPIENFDTWHIADKKIEKLEKFLLDLK